MSTGLAAVAGFEPAAAAGFATSPGLARLVCFYAGAGVFFFLSASARLVTFLGFGDGAVVFLSSAKEYFLLLFSSMLT